MKERDWAQRATRPPVRALSGRLRPLGAEETGQPAISGSSQEQPFETPRKIPQSRHSGWIQSTPSGRPVKTVGNTIVQLMDLKIVAPIATLVVRLPSVQFT